MISLLTNLFAAIYMRLLALRSILECRPGSNAGASAPRSPAHNPPELPLEDQAFRGSRQTSAAKRGRQQQPMSFDQFFQVQPTIAAISLSPRHADPAPTNALE